MDKSPLEAVDSARRFVCACSIFGSLAFVFAAGLQAGVPLPPEPARFWIARSNQSPTGPIAPTINAVNGGTLEFDIWAQPATVGSGPFSVGNPFKLLQGFSLNLVADSASAPVVEFVAASIEVHNPTVGAEERFAFVSDHNSVPPVVPLSNGPNGTQRLVGLQGFVLLNPENYALIGGSGCNGDPHCVVLPGGAPAWRVATFQLQTIQPSGTANYRLQIGAVGMLHVGDPGESADTLVAFGTDAFGADFGPTYNADTQRNTTNETTDSPDLVIHAVAGLLGDFNSDGRVDAGDYVRWRNHLGEENEANIGFRGDGDGVTITDYALWKQQYGEPQNGAGHGGLTLAVPEPAALCLWMMAFGLLRRDRSSLGAYPARSRERRSASIARVTVAFDRYGERPAICSLGRS